MPAYNPLIKGPSFERRPIKVICVGAGFSSIHLAARIRQYAPNVELLVIEKQDQLGGVWNAQRYPGVASDVPSHAYTLSWAPNPEWSRYYANGSEIQDYLLKCADMVHFRDNLRLSTSVDEATWDQQPGLWSVVLVDEKTGAKTTETANILISATGANSVPKSECRISMAFSDPPLKIVHFFA
jgi:cation diffusion facilitator CzcD-associated flavoprotein CzcO